MIGGRGSFTILCVLVVWNGGRRRLAWRGRGRGRRSARGSRGARGAAARGRTSARRRGETPRASGRRSARRAGGGPDAAGRAERRAFVFGSWFELRAPVRGAAARVSVVVRLAAGARRRRPGAVVLVRLSARGPATSGRGATAAEPAGTGSRRRRGGARASAREALGVLLCEAARGLGVAASRLQSAPGGATSQRRIVPSSEPVANLVPSGW